MLHSVWFIQRCKEITKQNKRVWIAYSGGIDSHVLLHLAASCLVNVHAVHVHHGLSPNADSWLEHCQRICAQLQVKLTTIKVNAKPNMNQSPEDAARIA